MLSEIMGEPGTPGASSESINAECHLAIKPLKDVCEEPPPELELEVQRQEHDLGEHPTIVPRWEDAMRGGPSEYFAKREEALTVYENKCRKSRGEQKFQFINERDLSYAEATTFNRIRQRILQTKERVRLLHYYGSARMWFDPHAFDV